MTTATERTIRVISAKERLMDGSIETTAPCPFCRFINTLTEKCSHFLSVEHGCGGTVFTFGS